MEQSKLESQKAIMQYIETETDENFTIKRYESENKKWEFGWRQMIYGLRFNANPVGALGYTIEYSGGSNKLFNTLLNGLMLQIFELLPESITEREFTNIFPRNSQIKPLYKDAAWHLLSVVQFKKLKSVEGDYTQLNSYGLNFKINATNAEFAIYTDSTANIGTISAVKTNESWLITNFLVNQSNRRLGLGTYLLQKASQELWNESAQSIVLYTQIPENDSLKVWYTDMGFKVNSNGLYERKALDYNYGVLRLIIED